MDHDPSKFVNEPALTGAKDLQWPHLEEETKCLSKKEDELFQRICALLTKGHKIPREQTWIHPVRRCQSFLGQV